MPSNILGSYTHIEPYVYVNMGLQEHFAHHEEADGAVANACKRLKRMRAYRRTGEQCDGLYHMDTYTVINTAFQNSKIVARTVHVSYDICYSNRTEPYGDSYHFNALSGITSQRVQLHEYNRMSYGLQQAFLFAVNNDKRHIFNLLNDMNSQDFAHDTVSTMLSDHQDMLHKLSGSRKSGFSLPYTYVSAASLRRSYTTTIYVGSDCDSMCAYATLSARVDLPHAERLKTTCINATRHYVATQLAYTQSSTHSIAHTTKLSTIDSGPLLVESLPTAIVVGFVLPLSVISATVFAVTSGLWCAIRRLHVSRHDNIENTEATTIAVNTDIYESSDSRLYDDVLAPTAIDSAPSTPAPAAPHSRETSAATNNETVLRHDNMLCSTGTGSSDHCYPEDIEVDNEIIDSHTQQAYDSNDELENSVSSVTQSDSALHIVDNAQDGEGLLFSEIANTSEVYTECRPNTE